MEQRHAILAEPAPALAAGFEQSDPRIADLDVEGRKLTFEMRQLEGKDVLVDTVDKGVTAIDPGKGEGHAQTSSSSSVQLVAAPYSSFSIVNPTTCITSCGR